MSEAFEEYDGYIWRLITRIRYWGYKLSDDDVSDMLQEGRIAAFMNIGLDSESILHCVRRAVYSAFLKMHTNTYILWGVSMEKDCHLTESLLLKV